MQFFQKSSSSTSAPHSPSIWSTAVNNTDFDSPKRLTRARRIRHQTQHELGLTESNPLTLTSTPSSPPPSSSPHSARTPLSPPPAFSPASASAVAVPQPLPRPEHLALNSPPALASSPRRNSGDQFAIKSKSKPSSNPRRTSSQPSKAESANHGLRLDIAPRVAPRSAPSSNFSSPMVSPRSSNVDEEFSLPCFYYHDSSKCSGGCCKGQYQYLNIECFNQKLNLIDSPKSAPHSRFNSPAVSPQRSHTGDFLPSFMSTQPYQTWSASDVPDLGRHAGHTSRASPVKSTAHNLDRSPIHPSLQSPQRDKKSHSKFSFLFKNKMLARNCKERPETNSFFSAHPLPLPPVAASPQSSIPSQAQAVVPHYTIDKPNMSLRKTEWVKGKLLGCGTYGRVYVGTNRETGALCAMKEVDVVPGDPKSMECIKQLEQEIKFLQHLDHPNIVRYFGCEIVDDHFYIYLENVYPGSISKYVQEHCGEMTESIVRNFTRHILQGLAYLHSKKTIHRDIKGANLLVNSSGTVKLADFGMAKHLNGLSYELSLKGSPHWMAPEVIKAAMQKDASPDLALAVDIWSLGCTVIEMFTGKPPWGDLHGPSAMFKALNRSPPIPEAMSPEGKDFLSSCFRRNPADRPSASALLEHPFIRNSSELNPSSCPLALKNIMDKSQNSRDGAVQTIDLMPTSPGTLIPNDKLATSSETSQQSCVKAFNFAAASNRSPCSPTRQMVFGSPNFVSSSNISSSMPIGSVSNHPLVLLKSHGREVPHI